MSATAGDLVLRRDYMLALIREREFVAVAELSERFGISEVTVRSDLDALAVRGDVQRIRGGAIPREPHAAEERTRIGRAAAALVRDGETLLIDAGATPAARALAQRTGLRNVVAFTNGLDTALELEAAAPGIGVVIVGGTLHRRLLVGPFAALLLEQIHVHTLLLGCDGIDERAVTSADPAEAEVKRRMLQAAERVVVLADAGKIGRTDGSRVCPIERVDLLITGHSAARELPCEVRTV